MSRKVASILLVAALLTTACGRAPTSPSAGGGERPTTAREVQGNLTLPPGTSVSLPGLQVVTAWGEGGVSQTGQNTASFTATVTEGGAQLVIARNSSGQLVLLGTSGPDASLQLNSQSTAEALLLLNPVLGIGGDLELARTFLRVVRERNITAPVQTAVEQQLQSLAHIDPTQDPLRTALNNAFQQVYQLIRSGAFASSTRPQTSQSPPRQPKPGARRTAIDPTTEQSGITLMDGDDPPDDVTYNVLLLNHRRRWVTFAYQAVNHDGTRQPWRCDLVPPTPAFSVGGLITGEFRQPGARQFSLSADPAAVSKIDVDVVGVGIKQPSNPLRAPFQCWDEAFLSDLTFELFLPLLGFIVGFSTNFLGVLEPQFRDVWQVTVADFAAAFVSQAGDAYAALRSGQLPSMTDFVRLMVLFVRVLVDTPAGGQLLEYVLLRLAERGVAGLTKLGVQAALRKVNAFLLVLSMGEFVYNVLSVLDTWDNSRSVEYWTITPPQSPPTFYFEASLTWQQPTDLDLYTTAPNGEVAWYGNRVISVGELDRDDIDGIGPETFTLRRKLVGRYRIDVDFYRYSDQTSGSTMPTSYDVFITLRNGQQYPCRSGVLGAPGDRVVACFVDVDDAGRVTVTPVTNAAGVRPTDVGRDAVKPVRR